MARVTAKLTPGPAVERLRELGRKKVAVGVIGAKAGAQHKGGADTVVDVATWMEFGTVNAAGQPVVPARSFIRATLIADRDTIRSFVLARTRRVMSGKATASQLYDEVGLKLRALMQARIRAGIPPELKHREGVPLIDSGQLIGAIGHETRSK